MKLKLSLIILLFAGGIPISCLKDSCDGTPECPPITGDYFDIVGVELYNHTYQINGDHISFTGNLSFDDSLDLKGLVVDFDVNYVSTNTNVKCKGFNLFMNSAIACSCPENGSFGLKGKYLKELHVITINDFNDEFSANDTLNEIIYLNNYLDYESYSDGSLYSKYLTLQDFIENEHKLKSPRLYMTMIEQPDSGEPFQVKVVVELLTGETYENISIPWL